MSSSGDLLYAALSGDATVTGLVGTRIYPNKIPQGPRAMTFTAIVYQVVSDLPQNALTGDASNRLRNARVQVDCYAKKYDTAQAIADAVDTVVTKDTTLNGWREISRDFYEDEAELHRVSMDVLLWR
jgi:hypothetical protein